MELKGLKMKPLLYKLSNICNKFGAYVMISLKKFDGIWMKALHIPEI